MKKYLWQLLGCSFLLGNLALAQPTPDIPQPTARRARPGMEKDSGEYVWVRTTNSLPKFDLDFPGGTPKDLAQAIEKATGKPLNTVIPDNYAGLKIPSLSVKNVTVAHQRGRTVALSICLHSFAFLQA